MEDWTQMTSRQFGTGSRPEPQLALFAPDSTGSLTDLFSETEN